MRKRYNSYSEIPPLVEDYLLTVAARKCIMSMSLEDINSFMEGLDEFYKNKEEVYEDGWVE